VRDKYFTEENSDFRQEEALSQCKSDSEFNDKFRAKQAQMHFPEDPRAGEETLLALSTKSAMS